MEGRRKDHIIKPFVISKRKRKKQNQDINKCLVDRKALT